MQGGYFVCLYFQHMDAAGDKRIKKFKKNPDADDVTKLQPNKQQSVSSSQFKISKAGKKISDVGRTLNADGTTRKKRAVNFSQRELDELSKLCAENIEVMEAELQGPGCDVGEITVKKQTMVWLKICDRINSMGVAKRDVPQLKRKWNAIKGNGKWNTFTIPSF